MGGQETNSKLNLIDLAGSERVNKSGAKGAQLKEAQAINKSLSNLCNVIEALKKKQSHVPYRDSKLTYYLQTALGGNSKVMMFVNVSPTTVSAEETLCSLNFGKRARATELGRATKNVRKSKRSKSNNFIGNLQHRSEEPSGGEHFARRMSEIRSERSGR